MGKIKTRERLCGVSVPLGALRGDGVVGEYPDLGDFGAFCAKTGFALVQILPVNDTGYESSPYSALSAFALHPLYIKVAAIPEAAGFDDAALRKAFGSAPRFPYQEILRAKMKIFRDIFEKNKAEIFKKAEKKGPLGKWIDSNPWVKEYAVFRTQKERNNEKSWKEWEDPPERNAEAIAKLWEAHGLREEHTFWAWLQEIACSQLRVAAQALAEQGIVLEGDLPILINEDSADVWAHEEYFQTGLSAGAPPDMYSPDGQNWGFPIYDWAAQEADGYRWWKDRLKAAEQYYSAYRIDHVLGFFRIWASSRKDRSAVLGRFLPYIHINMKDLAGLGFDEGRIRWVSQPHIPTSGPWEAGLAPEETGKIFQKALERIGDEELWLFKKSIKGENDIYSLGLGEKACEYLVKAWRNRLFLEYAKGRFVPVWYYRDSGAYQSLSPEERERLEALIARRQQDSESNWEYQGRRLLEVMIAAAKMLPCAEDLGAVPPCVPRVLTDLNILGLRVFRWFRAWDQEGEPYIPFSEYPELSVATPAVHDSSTVREWWEREADREALRQFLKAPGLGDAYSPETAAVILGKVAGAASRYRVFQIQDLLHLSEKWYAPDPSSERINVPGTANDFNWTYRLPAPLKEILADKKLISAVQELAAPSSLSGLESFAGDFGD
jgi:4-alpha-glucanotransferase